MPISISQSRRPIDRAAADRSSHLIVLMPAGKRLKDWTDVPYADILRRRLRDRGGLPEHATEPFSTELPNAAGTRVSLHALPSGLGSFERLTLARRHAALHLQHNPDRVAVIAPGFTAAETHRIMEAMISALLAKSAPMPAYKSKQPAPPRLRQIALYGMERRLDARRAQAEAEGNGLARALTALPPNELTPAIYRRRIAALARAHGWRMRFLDSRALRRLRAGAFLAVAQGSASDDAGIVHLRYNPPRAMRGSALALVGKGICFDTGGMNLKPAKHMHGMHEDMEGSAVALGTLLALSRLKAPFAIDCWLALAQNHIGPRAYKQNDIVTACNGTTVEVMHTDAEGRMVLADTLSLASRERPRLIIDYATLTGACVYALGTRYSGAFTNRDDLVPEIIAAGRASGERVWPFPLDEDYDQALESGIADIKQCTLEGEADHILAARFLKRFVGERAWLHIDLSAGNNKGGLAHIPTDVTGFGVRFTLNLLLDRGVLGLLRSETGTRTG
jgi:leucyl aminopeptidase